MQRTSSNLPQNRQRSRTPSPNPVRIQRPRTSNPDNNRSSSSSSTINQASSTGFSTSSLSTFTKETSVFRIRGNWQKGTVDSDQIDPEYVQIRNQPHRTKIGYVLKKETGSINPQKNVYFQFSQKWVVGKITKATSASAFEICTNTNIYAVDLASILQKKARGCHDAWLETSSNSNIYKKYETVELTNGTILEKNSLEEINGDKRSIPEQLIPPSPSPSIMINDLPDTIYMTEAIGLIKHSSKSLEHIENGLTSNSLKPYTLVQSRRSGSHVNFLSLNVCAQAIQEIYTRIKPSLDQVNIFQQQKKQLFAISAKLTITPVQCATYQPTGTPNEIRKTVQNLTGIDIIFKIHSNGKLALDHLFPTYIEPDGYCDVRITSQSTGNGILPYYMLLALEIDTRMHVFIKTANYDRLDSSRF